MILTEALKSRRNGTGDRTPVYIKCSGLLFFVAMATFHEYWLVRLLTQVIVINLMLCHLTNRFPPCGVGRGLQRRPGDSQQRDDPVAARESDMHVRRDGGLRPICTPRQRPLVGLGARLFGSRDNGVGDVSLGLKRQYYVVRIWKKKDHGCVDVRSMSMSMSADRPNSRTYSRRTETGWKRSDTT